METVHLNTAINVPRVRELLAKLRESDNGNGVVPDTVDELERILLPPPAPTISRHGNSTIMRSRVPPGTTASRSTTPVGTAFRYSTRPGSNDDDEARAAPAATPPIPQISASTVAIRASTTARRPRTTLAGISTNRLPPSSDTIRQPISTSVNFPSPAGFSGARFPTFMERQSRRLLASPRSVNNARTSQTQPTLPLWVREKSAKYQQLMKELRKSLIEAAQMYVDITGRFRWHGDGDGGCYEFTEVSDMLYMAQIISKFQVMIDRPFLARMEEMLMLRVEVASWYDTQPAIHNIPLGLSNERHWYFNQQVDTVLVALRLLPLEES